MAEVTIRYCAPCRYLPKAIQDADAILKEFGETLSALRLVPADHGVYDVAVDGAIVFSLEKTMRFPESTELSQEIRARVKPRKARKKA
jgi:selenoprotein W-related protein